MAEAEVLTEAGQDLCPDEFLDRLQQGCGCRTEHDGEIVETKRSPEDGRGDCGPSRRSWHPVESFPHAVTDTGRKPGLNQHSLRPVDPDQALLKESPKQLDQQ